MDQQERVFGGVLKAIESALELPGEEKDGHLIHTPNGPRVAHMSHLPVEEVPPKMLMNCDSCC